MRLLKRGPRQGTRLRLPRNPSSADREELTRFALASQTLGGWSGARRLELHGSGYQEWGATCGGWQEPPGFPQALPMTSGQTKSQCPRRTRPVPTARSSRDGPPEPLFLSQSRVFLLPRTPPQPPQMSLSSRQWDEIALILYSLCHLLAVGSWSDTITSLSLSVPIWKMGIIHTSQGHCDPSVRQHGSRAWHADWHIVGAQKCSIPFPFLTAWFWAACRSWGHLHSTSPRHNPR